MRDGFAKCAACGVVVFRDELDGDGTLSVALRPEGPSCFDCRAAFLYALVEPISKEEWDRHAAEVSRGETTIVLIGEWDNLREDAESRN